MNGDIKGITFHLLEFDSFSENSQWKENIKKVLMGGSSV